MPDTKVSAAVMRHIEELEAALRHVEDVADPLLGREVGKLVDGKRVEFGWAGEVDEDHEPTAWLAPEEWRTADDTDDNFDLYINIEGTGCADGRLPQTWLAYFAGFAGAGIQLLVGTNALTQAKWKNFLRSNGDILNELIGNGFRCDARDGVLVMPIALEKVALINAFEEEDFDEALKPIAAALDRARAARPSLDKLVELIRAK